MVMIGFINIAWMLKQRRFLEKEFQKQNKGKPLIRKILNFLRFNNKKGVKSWHQ